MSREEDNYVDFETGEVIISDKTISEDEDKKDTDQLVFVEDDDGGLGLLDEGEDEKVIIDEDSLVLLEDEVDLLGESEGKVEIVEEADLLSDLVEIEDLKPVVNKASITTSVNGLTLTQDDLKNAIYLQKKMEYDLSSQYMNRIIQDKYGNNKRAMEKLSKMDKIMSVDEELREGIDIQQFMLWAKSGSISEKIMDKELESTLIVEYISHLLDSKKDLLKTWGVDGEINEDTIDNNKVLTKLRIYLERLIEFQRMSQIEDEKEQQKSDNVIKAESVKAHESLTWLKDQLEQIKNANEIVETRSISIKKSISKEVFENKIESKMVVEKSCVCGKCGSEIQIKPQHNFIRFNKFFDKYSKGSVDLNQYLIDKEKSKGSNKIEIKRRLTVFFPVNKCPNCGAVNTVPLTCIRNITNLCEANLLNHLDLSQGVESLAFDTFDYDVNKLKMAVGSDLEINYEVMAGAVTDYTEVKYSTVKQNLREYVDKLGDNINKFRTFNRCKYDNEFQVFSLLAYSSSFGSNDTISGDNFGGLVNRILNAVCDSPLYKAFKTKIEYYNGEAFKIQNVLNDIDRLQYISDCYSKQRSVYGKNLSRDVINNNVKEVFKKINSMVDYEGLTLKEDTLMFDTADDYATGHLSVDFLCEFEKLKDIKRRQIMDNTTINEDRKKYIENILDPQVFQWLTVYDYPSTKNTEFFSMFNLSDEIVRNFVNELVILVMSKMICINMFSYFKGLKEFSNKIKELHDRDDGVKVNTDDSDTVDYYIKFLNKKYKSKKYKATRGELGRKEDYLENLKSKYLLNKGFSSKFLGGLNREALEKAHINLDFTELDKAISQYGKELGKIVIDMSGVGFSIEELKDYYITNKNKYNSISNYIPRKGNETIDEYLVRIRQQKEEKPLRKVNEDQICETYLLNPRIYEKAMEYRFYDDYFEGDWIYFFITKILSIPLASDFPMEAKCAFMGMDMNLVVDNALSDWKFSLDEVIKEIAGFDDSEKEEFVRYLNTITPALKDSSEYPNWCNQTPMEIMETLKDDIRTDKPETDEYDMDKETNKERVIEYLTQLSDQIPPSVKVKFKTIMEYIEDQIRIG